MSIDSNWTKVDELYLDWVRHLYPINRSLSGLGNIQTLEYLKSKAPDLEIKEIRSGEIAFDWIVPDEWLIEDAYIETYDKRRFAEFKKCNLHVVGYSQSVDTVVSKQELMSHLHFLDNLPEAIPYVTSYYEKNWGFCLKRNDVDLLGDGPFRVFIDSSFKSAEQGGCLVFGELYIEGQSKQEILISTYICHPSMANNELSGPVVATAIARILSRKESHYSYRFLFLPETIGAIHFLNRNLEYLKKYLIAGFVLTCIGDTGKFSYIASRVGNNYADRCAQETLKEFVESFNEYSWLDRGSDERQYCAPGVDLPVCSISRSKHGAYPEYHTSLDDLSLITEKSLRESILLISRLIEKIESQRVPKLKTLCEPQLGKRELFPNISKGNSHSKAVMEMMDVISFFDGGNSLQEIAQKANIPLSTVTEIVEKFKIAGLIEL